MAVAASVFSGFRRHYGKGCKIAFRQGGINLGVAQLCLNHAVQQRHRLCPCA